MSREFYKGPRSPGQVRGMEGAAPFCPFTLSRHFQDQAKCSHGATILVTLLHCIAKRNKWEVETRK